VIFGLLTLNQNGELEVKKLCGSMMLSNSLYRENLNLNSSTSTYYFVKKEPQELEHIQERIDTENIILPK
jgi:hypothetical protein